MSPVSGLNAILLQPSNKRVAPCARLRLSAAFRRKSNPDLSRIRWIGISAARRKVGIKISIPENDVHCGCQTSRIGNVGIHTKNTRKTNFVFLPGNLDIQFFHELVKLFFPNIGTLGFFEERPSDGDNYPTLFSLNVNLDPHFGSGGTEGLTWPTPHVNFARRELPYAQQRCIHSPDRRR